MSDSRVPKNAWVNRVLGVPVGDPAGGSVLREDRFEPAPHMEPGFDWAKEQDFRSELQRMAKLVNDIFHRVMAPGLFSSLTYPFPEGLAEEFGDASATG